MNKTPWVGGDLGMGALKFYGARGATQLVSQVSVNGVAKMAHVPGLKSIARPLHIAYSVQSLLRQWISALTVQRRGLLQSPAPLHTFPQWTADLETAELQIVRRRNVKHAVVAYA